MKAFFQVLFSLILTNYKVRIHLLFLGAVCSAGLFDLGYKFSFLFSSEIVKLFSP